jgi:hypothetical protein
MKSPDSWAAMHEADARFKIVLLSCNFRYPAAIAPDSLLPPGRPSASLTAICRTRRMFLLVASKSPRRLLPLLCGAGSGIKLRQGGRLCVVRPPFDAHRRGQHPARPR